jgi:hypothetical protein
VDLPAFAKHRKAASANVDDVLLVARHNPALRERLGDFVEYHDLAGPKPKRRREDPIDVDDGDDMRLR